MLIIEPNFKDTDGFYEKLIDCHQNLTLEQSQSFNAKLILLLANHIGDNDILFEAFERAKQQ
jgi:Protein of unknown function (DUF2783)